MSDYEQYRMVQGDHGLYVPEDAPVEDPTQPAPMPVKQIDVMQYRGLSDADPEFANDTFARLLAVAGAGGGGGIRLPSDKPANEKHIEMIQQLAESMLGYQLTYEELT